MTALRKQLEWNMGNVIKRGFQRGFGIDEYGMLLVPPKMSNVTLSCIEHTRGRGGCPYCYPHGPETSSSKWEKDLRSWKRYRKTQYRPLPVQSPVPRLFSSQGR